VASGSTDSVVGEVGPAIALNEGFQLALLVAAGIVVVAVALTAIVGRGPRRTPAQRPATTGAVAAQGEAR
jgi:sulfite exporter TauE/SafE